LQRLPPHRIQRAQELGEAGVTVGLRRQVVGEDGGVDLGGGAHLLVDVAALDEQKADQQQRQRRQRGDAQPPRGRARHRERAAALHLGRRGDAQLAQVTRTVDRAKPRHPQAFGDVVREDFIALRQRPGDAQRDPGFEGLRVQQRAGAGERCSSNAGHGVIPLALKAFANA